MRVFLTGATGFVGGYLLRQFSKDGHTPRALVRSEADAAAIREMGGEPIPADLLDPESIERCVQHIDVVVHCGRLPSETEAELFFRANTLGSLLLLEKARTAGVKQFTFISSILVYGLKEAVYLPGDEKHPVSPLEQAGTYKVAIETCCQYYHSRHGMNTSVYRVGGVFGRASPSAADRQADRQWERLDQGDSPRRVSQWQTCLRRVWRWRHGQKCPFHQGKIRFVGGATRVAAYPFPAKHLSVSLGEARYANGNIEESFVGAEKRADMLLFRAENPYPDDTVKANSPWPQSMKRQRTIDWTRRNPRSHGVSRKNEQPVAI